MQVKNIGDQTAPCGNPVRIADSFALAITYIYMLDIYVRLIGALLFLVNAYFQTLANVLDNTWCGFIKNTLNVINILFF